MDWLIAGVCRVYFAYIQWISLIFFHRRDICPSISFFPFYLVVFAKTYLRGHRGHDRMVVGFTTTYRCNQCLSPLKLWVRTSFMARCTRYNSMWYSLTVQWLATNMICSPGNSHHDIAEIFLKVDLYWCVSCIFIFRMNFIHFYHRRVFARVISLFVLLSCGICQNVFAYLTFFIVTLFALL